MRNLNHNFQKAVDKFLIRHQSIIDVTSKFQEAAAHSNRAIAKAVTTCGCVKITARRQQLPNNIKFSEIKNYLNTHLEGKLCDTCREAIERELGITVFYFAGICGLLELDFNEIIKKELDKISTLGVYSLT